MGCWRCWKLWVRVRRVRTLPREEGLLHHLLLSRKGGREGGLILLPRGGGREEGWLQLPVGGSLLLLLLLLHQCS